ncbi:unnamed protein product [Amoebophrya sp. A120]|nr:unnamed protein product [Amoebophrya sp. A120]|eukprot:GSA120T00014008001.1
MFLPLREQLKQQQVEEQAQAFKWREREEQGGKMDIMNKKEEEECFRLFHDAFRLFLYLSEIKFQTHIQFCLLLLQKHFDFQLQHILPFDFIFYFFYLLYSILSS